MKNGPGYESYPSPSLYEVSLISTFDINILTHFMLSKPVNFYFLQTRLAAGFVGIITL